MFEAIQDEPMKPENWPANVDESALQNIFDAIKRFIDEPNYKTKEVLISLVSSYDLNQKSHLGLFRITEYEVYFINTIYLYAMMIQFNTAKTYLYELVGERARMINTLRKMQVDVNVNDDAYEFLLPSLKLYYWIYSDYNWNKNRSLADQIINNMNQIINNSS